MKDILQRAVTELDILNLTEHDFGKAVIQLLKTSHELCHGDSALIRRFLEMPSKIYNEFPLTSISEEDFVEDEYGVKRCVRYNHAYLNPDDNQYYDAHGKVFINPEKPYTHVYKKNGNKNSTVRIESFPYQPSAQVIEDKENV